MSVSISLFRYNREVCYKEITKPVNLFISLVNVNQQYSKYKCLICKDICQEYSYCLPTAIPCKQHNICQKPLAPRSFYQHFFLRAQKAGVRYVFMYKYGKIKLYSQSHNNAAHPLLQTTYLIIDRGSTVYSDNCDAFIEILIFIIRDIMHSGPLRLSRNKSQ